MHSHNPETPLSPLILAVHPACPRRILSHAFTLVELLTVIAIIGILAALILPTVGKMRQSARSAQCKSNLRQIGIAAALYSADNKQQFPCGNLRQQNADGTTSFVTWNKTLTPYLNSVRHTGVEVVVCPASERQPARGNAQPQYSANKSVWADKGEPPVPVSAVTRPSLVIALVDGALRDDGTGDTIPYQAGATLSPTLLNISAIPPDGFISTPTGNGSIDYRHPTETTNSLMCDGSVRSFKKGTLQNKQFIAD